MAKQLVITIGLPFSGKSRLAREYAKRGYQIIERDNILPEILLSEKFSRQVAERAGGRTDLSAQQKFDIRNEVAIDLLNAKIVDLVLHAPAEKLFYDGTNLQRRVRAKLLALRDQGVQVDGVFLDVPFEEILDRARRAYENGERAGHFNEQAILSLRKMIELFDPPEKSEGFHELTVLHPVDLEVGREIRQQTR